MAASLTGRRSSPIGPIINVGVPSSKLNHFKSHVDPLSCRQLEYGRIKLEVVKHWTVKGFDGGKDAAAN
jgi:hypothetical protein